MTRQASQIQVLTLQFEDASCQLDRSCVDVSHPSTDYRTVPARQKETFNLDEAGFSLCGTNPLYFLDIQLIIFLPRKTVLLRHSLFYFHFHLLPRGIFPRYVEANDGLAGVRYVLI